MTGARGEAILRTEEREYSLLFTNRALAQAERATGKGVLQLLSAGQAQALGMNDVAQLVTLGLEAARRDNRAGGRSYTMDDTWQILDELGFVAVFAAVLEALAAVIAYSPSAERTDDPPA